MARWSCAYNQILVPNLNFPHALKRCWAVGGVRAPVNVKVVPRSLCLAFLLFCKLELHDAGRSLTKLLQDKPPGLGAAGASPKGAHRGKSSQGMGSNSPGQHLDQLSHLPWGTQSSLLCAEVGQSSPRSCHIHLYPQSQCSFKTNSSLGF